MMPIMSEQHSTVLELEFISKLGSFSASHQKTRKELLEGYISAANMRVRWGNIDKDLVFKRARKHLKVEKARQ